MPCCVVLPTQTHALLGYARRQAQSDEDLDISTLEGPLKQRRETMQRAPWMEMEEVEILGDGDEPQRQLRLYEKGVLTIFPLVAGGLYALAIAALGQRI